MLIFKDCLLDLVDLFLEEFCHFFGVLFLLRNDSEIIYLRFEFFDLFGKLLFLKKELLLLFGNFSLEEFDSLFF